MITSALQIRKVKFKKLLRFTQVGSGRGVSLHPGVCDSKACQLPTIPCVNDPAGRGGLREA